MADPGLPPRARRPLAGSRSAHEKGRQRRPKPAPSVAGVHRAAKKGAETRVRQTSAPPLARGFGSKGARDGGPISVAVQTPPRRRPRPKHGDQDAPSRMSAARARWAQKRLSSRPAAALMRPTASSRRSTSCARPRHARQGHAGCCAVLRPTRREGASRRASRRRRKSAVRAWSASCASGACPPRGGRRSIRRQGPRDRADRDGQERRVLSSARGVEMRRRYRAGRTPRRILQRKTTTVHEAHRARPGQNFPPRRVSSGRSHSHPMVCASLPGRAGSAVLSASLE